MHEQPNQRLSREEAVWVLQCVCKHQHIPFDAGLFTHLHPPGADGAYQLADLLLAAQGLGLQAQRVPLATSTASATSAAFTALANWLPVLLIWPQPTPALRLIVGTHQGQLLGLAPGQDEPTALDAAMLGTQAIAYAFTKSAPPIPHDDAPDATAATASSTGPSRATPAAFGFAWFIPELLRYRSVWRDILAASLALQLVGLATPLFTQVVVDKVVVHHSHSTLVAAGVGLALAIVFSALFSWVRQYLILHTGNRVDAVLGSRAFAHVLKLPLPYFAHRATGTLVARLQGVEHIREFLAGAAITLLLDLPFMVILLAVMFWYSWQLSLISLGLLALLSFLSVAVAPLFKQRMNQQFMLGARNQAFVTEYIGGMETVKALQLEPQLDKRYGTYLADYVAAGFKTRQLGNTYHTAAQALEQLQGLAVLVVGALLVMQSDGFTIGMLVAFQMFAGRLSQPLLRLVGLFQEFQQASLSVRRLGDLMNAPAEPYSLIPARVASGPGDIEFQSVSFRYSAERAWLYRDLSLRFAAGKTTLLVGPSGCGKSTLAKLLLGFHRPEEGCVLLDGQDARHFSANELRSRFGVVPQETQLFAGTIYDNLQLANPLAEFGHIVQACRMAEIHEAIERLPQGYQTEIGEGGVGLSGGQKQRIAIARALLKRPRVLLFDEATASLDNHTASQLAATINRLRGKVTVVFIAHQVPRGLVVDATVSLDGPATHTAAAQDGGKEKLR